MANDESSNDQRADLIGLQFNKETFTLKLYPIEVKYYKKLENVTLNGACGQSARTKDLLNKVIENLHDDLNMIVFMTL